VHQCRDQQQHRPAPVRSGARRIEEAPQRPQDQPVRHQIGVDIAIGERRQRGEQDHAAPQGDRPRRVFLEQQPGEKHLQEQAEQDPWADELRVRGQQ